MCANIVRKFIKLLIVRELLNISPPGHHHVSIASFVQIVQFLKKKLLLAIR